MKVAASLEKLTTENFLFKGVAIEETAEESQ